MLSSLTNVDNAVKEAHIKNIEEKYLQEEADTKESIVPEQNEMICPKCGSKMVLRTATKGENKGNQFWGCSSFPKCRYILNIK